MTHEFKNIVEASLIGKKQNFKSVLASVVALDGSSYRRPGVRMLILENESMIGAVSGGCVEKEILRQSKSVFKTGVPKLMMYDGRYRLGCEGILYILIEVFQPEEAFYKIFSNWIKNRQTFEISSYFKKEACENPEMGSIVTFNNETFCVSGTKNTDKNTNLSEFKQEMTPCFKLLIIGSEHDAAKLCNYSALTGWETTIVSGPSESRTIRNFPGATEFYSVSAEEMDLSIIDNQTAIVLMTHNFASDLRFLVALKSTKPTYIGLLGPAIRRDDLLSQFFEYCPEIESDFMDLIHGPAGINIGAESAEEIAISVMSEILAIVRKQEPIFLSKKQGRIHSKLVKK